MKTLHELCNIIGHTDQHTHAYTKLFDEIIPALEPKNILLLGVNMFGGGDVWAYSTRFPDAVIYAVDREFNKIEPIISNTCTNVKWIQGDIYCDGVFDQIKNVKFDVIIDDADHIHAYQYYAFMQYSVLLKEGGIYFIEDIGNEYWCNQLQQLIKNTKAGCSFQRMKSESSTGQVMLVIQ